jgi:LDH2 family malate/lactate/ureidoglycolate dehydrogenase
MTTTEAAARYDAGALIDFARKLFVAAGCDADKARTLAEVLVEGDLLGHTTHGLQLAAGYLEEIANGTMTATGEPTTVSDRGAVVTWDGRKLPGVWLTVKALDLAAERAKRLGIGAVAIRNSHHIACLAAYLERVTAQGLMALIASSDPSEATVAPFGGRRAMFTPDPIAVGIPTEGAPILIDISASITTNGLTNRLRREGKCYPGLWAQDADGRATDDPNALFTDPPGTLLPTGGQDHGHKGYALALTVEALTQGLSGFGRVNPPTGWSAGVFVQVWDPEAFAGLPHFRHEMEWIAEACRNTPPVPGIDAVRLPGERGLARKRAAMANGVKLYPGIMKALATWAEKYGVTPPAPRG